MSRLVGSLDFFHNIRRLRTFNHVNRYLNTSNTNLNPRGVRISTESRKSEARNEENLTKSVDKHHHKSESLKCGTADPVVLKFTKMLNDIQKGNSQEKVYDTQFGKIRFDTENVPVIHGQFESKSKEISENEIDRLDGEMISNQESAGFDDNVKDMNFVDDVWFGESYENYKETSKSSNSQEVNKSLGCTPPLKSDLNFIDESTFGEAYVATHHHNDSTLLEPIKNSSDVNEREAKFNTKDSFIDQVYFNEPLDKINENKQHHIEFSTIRTDFEKALLDIDDENEIKSEKIFSEAPSNIDNFKEFYLNPTSFSDVKTDFEKAIIEPDNKDEALTDNIKNAEGQLYLESSDDSLSLSKIEENSRKQIIAPTEFSKTKILLYERRENLDKDSEKKETAYDYVLKMRKKQEEDTTKIVNNESTQKNFETIIQEIQNLDEMSHYDVLKLLKQSILYDKYDIVGLYKPYGIAMHAGTSGSKHVLSDYLEDLAKTLKVQKLYTLHRLDVQTTGVLLLAKTPEMAEKLKEMFKNRRLTKTYMAITKGIPNNNQGILDIPIAEGMIDGRRRMALQPIVEGVKKSQRKSKIAITKYKVLSSINSSSLIEVVPVTGVKHQIRVHLGFGLATPVLGDHKYSHLKKLAPQRLSGDMLEHLQMPQSRVRKLPMFLHAKSIFLPEIIEGRNISIQAALPPYFTKAIRMLELHRYRNKIKEISQNTITIL